MAIPQNDVVSGDPKYDPKAITRTDANGNIIYLTDPNGNEITSRGKKTAGVILVIGTVLTALVLVAHWPDKMPPNEGSKVCTKYQYRWFHMNYLGIDGKATGDTVINVSTSSLVRKAAAKKDTVVVDTNAVNSESSPEAIKQPDAQTSDVATKPDTTNKKSIETAICKKSCTGNIDLNTLILLLVALAGFLGNMIHIASSFTNFIGAGKFKRSWMMWYWVKPFTAAALAVGVYIIFRAGFLNSAEASANINLYGVVAIALLAGLFTDMATQKLKEIFGVVFQTSTVRPNPLEHPPVKITSTIPEVLPLNDETQIVLSGSGFGNRTLKLSIDGEEISNALIQPNAIVFKYKAIKEKSQFIIYDEKGVEITKYELIAANKTEEQPPTATVTAITPDSITVNVATEIIIAGTGLNTAKLVIKVDEAVIAETELTKSADSIKFSYTTIAAGNIVVRVLNAKDEEVFNKSITVT